MQVWCNTRNDPSLIYIRRLSRGVISFIDLLYVPYYIITLNKFNFHHNEANSKLCYTCYFYRISFDYIERR